MTRIVVIGGGISGLTAALRLRERAPAGTEVLALEASPRAGGHARTLHEDGFRIEVGPNGFLSRAGEPEPLALIRDLGLESSLIEARPAAKRRFVVHGGRLRRVPDKPPALLTTDALTPLGKLRVLMEPFARPAPPGCDESVHEFARRRIGGEAADVLVDTAVSGISAGDSHALSVAAAFPLISEMEREHGSLIRAMAARRAPPPRLVSLAGGMSELVDTLAARLGRTLRTGAPVRTLTRAAGGWRVVLDDGATLAADRIVMAVPASRAAAVLEGEAPAQAAALGEFPFAGLAIVALAFRTADLPLALDGYGYLVASREGFDTLGVVWESSLFEGRAPAGTVLVRAMMGGVRRPEVATLAEDELVRRARAELERVLGPTAAPIRAWTWRHPAAIAQYTRGHLERVARARAEAARLPGLELCGTSYDGISFAAGIISAERAVARVLAALAARGPTDAGSDTPHARTAGPPVPIGAA